MLAVKAKKNTKTSTRYSPSILPVVNWMTFEQVMDNYEWNEPFGLKRIMVKERLQALATINCNTPALATIIHCKPQLFTSYTYHPMFTAIIHSKWPLSTVHSYYPSSTITIHLLQLLSNVDSHYPILTAIIHTGKPLSTVQSYYPSSTFIIHLLQPLSNVNRHYP